MPPRGLRRGPGRPAGARTRAGRSALLRGARELMREKGLPRITAREVAARAGVQPALVNYYFGSKAGLLRAVVEDLFDEVGSQIARAASGRGSVEERLRRIIDAWVGAIVAEPYAPRLVVEHVLFADREEIDEFAQRIARPILEAFRSLLDEGRAAGEIREVEPMFLLPSIAGSCVYFFLAAPVVQQLFGIEEVTPELARAFARSTGTLLMRGIAAGEDGLA